MLNSFIKRLIDNINRYPVAWSVVFIGIVLSWSTYVILDFERLEHTKQRFHLLAKERFSAIQNNLDILQSNLEDIQILYTSSKSVDREEFAKFTKHITDRYPFIVSLSWIPKIPHKQRASFEQKAQEENIEFKIIEPMADGKVIIAQKRDTYYPHYFVETKTKSYDHLGIDLGANKANLVAIHRAMDSGRHVVLENNIFVDGSNQKPTIIVIDPIYQNNKPINTVEQRREHFFGLVSLGFNIGDMIELSMQTMQPTGVDFILRDDKASEENRLLYNYSNRPYKGLYVSDDSYFSTLKNSWEYSETFDFAGRQWSFLAIPNENFFDQEKFKSFPMLFFITGLFLTTLLTLYIVRNKKNFLERQQAAKELAASQAKLNSILMSTGEAIYGIDLYGNCTFCNSACVDMLGYDDPQILIGKNMHTLIHHTREDGSPYLVHECNIYMAFREGKSVHVDNEVMWRLDGTSFPVDYHSVPLVQNGVVIGAVVSFTDITTHKSNMAILKESLEIAESASRAKSDFIANMSHEIRTPMNAIIGLTKLAIRVDPTPKMHNYLSKIEHSSHTLMSIIDDILDFSRIEAGRMELNLVKFNIRDLFDRLADLFSQQSTEKGVELILSIPPNFCHTALGDSLRLEQVLINLVRNAIKFTDQGIIVVELSSDNIARGSMEWSFCVSDTGIGIDPDILPKLFDPFEQADSSTTRNFGGTGLGLTICARLVEMMGGRIWATSVPGEGSKFYFTISADCLSLQDTDPIQIPETLKGLRVLVVDDHGVARNMTYNLLQSFDFNVESVHSGEEALTRIIETNTKSNSNPFKLVVMDCCMPNMDGITASHEIKKLFRTKIADGSVPKIILLTTSSQDKVQNHPQVNDLDAILEKPTSRFQLLNSILMIFGEDSINPSKTDKILASEIETRTKIKDARILVVDDNAINQQVAQELLELVGLNVDLANNGAQAIDKLQSNTYDTILMDIQMPVMGGLEATRYIRSELGFVKLPIIAMTAYAMPDEKIKCIEAGMNDHIAKPIRPERLYATLTKWVGPVKVPDLDSHNNTDDITLPDFPELNIQTGLMRMAGNRAGYRRLLIRFRKEHGKTANTIQNSIANGDLQEAKRLAHLIKGVSSNIGAELLFKATIKLEEALLHSDKDEQSEALELFTQAMAAVITSLQGLEEESPDDDRSDLTTSNFDYTLVSPLLAELEELLQKSSLETKEVRNALKEQLVNTDAEVVFREMESSLQSYNFEKAMQHFKTLQQEVMKISKLERQ
ncbi:MAG: response regulator [Magnetococcales bacterium]|nr:response regulator [Magnetococcales bacterium]